MHNNPLDEYYDILTAYTSEESIQLVTSINGYNMETLLDILFATTGYRNFEQLKEAIS